MADNNIPFSQFRTKPIRDIPEVSPEKLGDNDQILIVDNGPSNPPPRLLKIGVLKNFLDLVDVLRKNILGVPLGVATLDANARLNKTQLPLDVLKKADLADYVKVGEKGTANGVARLNIESKIVDYQLPDNLVRQVEFLGHTLSNSNPHNVTAAQINAEPAFTTLSPSKGGLGTPQLLGLIKGTADGYVSAVEGVDYISASNNILDGGSY